MPGPLGLGFTYALSKFQLPTDVYKNMNFLIYLDTAYYLKLKTKNKKYDNKIIFKSVNSAIGPNFNLKFAKFHICGSRKQYARPIKIKRKRATPTKKHYPN